MRIKSEDIIFYLTKYGDLIFKKYWVYSYLFGFIIFLNVILMIFLDNKYLNYITLLIYMFVLYVDLWTSFDIISKTPEDDAPPPLFLKCIPEVDWQTPAITTYLPGNHAIRSPRWRYIRYADGSEELYDHSVDPEEWVNLAQQAHAHAIKKRLAGWLPQNEATATPNLKR